MTHFGPEGPESPLPQELEPVDTGQVELDGGPVEEVEPSDRLAPVEPSDGASPVEADEPYDYRRSGRRRGRRGRRRRWPAILLALFVAVAVVAVVGYIRVDNDINPSGKPGRTVMVAVPAGTSTARRRRPACQGQGHPRFDGVRVVPEAERRRHCPTGHLPDGHERALLDGAVHTAKGPIPVTYKLVVPEGFTVRQIAAAVGRLKGAGISAKAFLEAATGGQVRSPYEPAGSNDLEGLLFPATYPVQQGETADELVQYMVATFDTHAAALGLTAAAQRLGYSPYQVINVASIVEREVKFEADRGGVASVIYNRLGRGIPIGAESTLLYGLGDPKGPVVITTPNPYNTLVNKGLPPTPISNPGIPSLEAAMHPPKTTYLYWVEINPDGANGLRLHDGPVQAAPGRVPERCASGAELERDAVAHARVGASVRGLRPRRWWPA